MTTPPKRFFVATDGSDEWSGTLPSPNASRTDGPFATLRAARDAIRRLQHSEGLHQPVEVQVRAGTYRFFEPLRLSGGDSGTARFPIAYMAYPGERPILSGGRPICNWEPYRDKIVCARLPQARTGRWWFRQLFFDGKRMVRARWPKLDRNDPLYGGWAFVEAPVLEGKELDDVARVELGPVWRFKPDPERVGQDQAWYGVDTDDSDWGTLRSGEWWNTQGFPKLHGAGWYRLRFRMPADFDTRRFLWLLFGGVDKEAHVYVDGKKVFEHTCASTGLGVLQIWNEPFKVDARPLLTPQREHVITVRVDSEVFNGGIWRPVWLVSADHEVPLRLLSGLVKDPVAFRYEEGVFTHRWSKPDQAEVFIVPGKSWISDIIPIKSVDYERRIIHLKRPVGPSCNTLEGTTHIETGNRFYVENALEHLTEPGEWCLDTDAGILYFWPPEGCVESGEVTAPATGSLIRMVGSPDAPVKHITFRGFTFTQTQACWPTPESYYKTPNAGQALYMENTQDCHIEGNFFDAVGGDAIRLQGRNARNRIAGNEIADAGAYGIFVGNVQRGFCRLDPCSGDVPGPPPWHGEPQDRDVVVKAWPRSAQHLISNNHIHHVGVFEKHACGIAFFGVSAVDVVVSHNLIHHTPRFGIGMMSGFGRVIIEYNELGYLSLETADTGGITSNRWYTYDKDPDLCRGNIIRFNYIHDVIGCGAYLCKAEPSESVAGGRIWVPYFGWGIYFDNAPMDVLVYGNICARSTHGGIMISHYAKNVTVENNIFVDGAWSQLYMLLAGEMSNVRVRRNIFSYSNPEADLFRVHLVGGADLRAAIVESDLNLFFNASGRELTVSGLPVETTGQMGATAHERAVRTLADWQGMGFDKRSVVTDPKFVDVAADNYNLQADSPAFALGFKRIDARRIGLIHDHRGKDCTAWQKSWMDGETKSP